MFTLPFAHTGNPHDRSKLVPLPPDANGATRTVAVAGYKAAEFLARLIAFAPAELLHKAAEGLAD